MQTAVHGKDLLPPAGEYTVEVIAQGLVAFVERHLPQHDLAGARAWRVGNVQRREPVAKAVGALPARPPGFCIGCPDRPVFSALKLAQQEIGPVHAAAVNSNLHQSLAHKNQSIADTLKGMDLQWMRVAHTCEVDAMRRTLERLRRIKHWIAGLLNRGERVERVKYGVDEDVCHGDPACVRLSGCLALMPKDNTDPLKLDPAATVFDGCLGCVGCGLCGANAHAATLCPSFYRAEVVRNPRRHERLMARLREVLTGALRPA